MIEQVINVSCALNTSLNTLVVLPQVVSMYIIVINPWPIWIAASCVPSLNICLTEARACDAILRCDAAPWNRWLGWFSLNYLTLFGPEIVSASSTLPMWTGS